MIEAVIGSCSFYLFIWLSAHMLEMWINKVNSDVKRGINGR